MAEEWLSTSQAARAVGVSPRSLARWVQDGDLEPHMVTVGGHYRWNVERLRQELAELALRRKRGE